MNSFPEKLIFSISQIFWWSSQLDRTGNKFSSSVSARTWAGLQEQEHPLGVLPGCGVCPTPSAGNLLWFLSANVPLQRGSWSSQLPPVGPGPALGQEDFSILCSLAASLWLSLNLCFTLCHVYLEKKGFKLGEAKRLFRRGKAGSAWDGCLLNVILMIRS